MRNGQQVDVNYTRLIKTNILLCVQSFIAMVFLMWNMNRISLNLFIIAQLAYLGTYVYKIEVVKEKYDTTIHLSTSTPSPMFSLRKQKR